MCDNNLCEAWNFSFAQLIGNKHPSVWTTIDGLQKDAIMACTSLDQDAVGQPPKKRVRPNTVNLKQQLYEACVAHRDRTKSLEDHLRTVAHIIRFTHK